MGDDILGSRLLRGGLCKLRLRINFRRVQARSMEIPSTTSISSRCKAEGTSDLTRILGIIDLFYYLANVVSNIPA